MKKIQVVTLFPEMFEGVLNSSMMWKAQKEGAVEFGLINLRDFGIGPRKQVDDTPYGGGDGMLLKPEPLFAAVAAAKEKDPSANVLLMTPRGQRWKQASAQQYADTDHGYIFICGRYEGIDERFLEKYVDEFYSIGDFVLTGGELAVMVMLVNLLVDLTYGLINPRIRVK